MILTSAIFSILIATQSATLPNDKQIGRYEFHPASGEMPALIFDTATGCIEFVERFELDNPKPGQSKYVWIRSRQDQVVTGTPKRCELEETK